MLWCLTKGHPTSNHWKTRRKCFSAVMCRVTYESPEYESLLISTEFANLLSWCNQISSTSSYPAPPLFFDFSNSLNSSVKSKILTSSKAKICLIFNHFLCVIQNTFCITSYVFEKKTIAFLYTLVFISVTSLTTGNLQRDHCTLWTIDRDDMRTPLETWISCLKIRGHIYYRPRLRFSSTKVQFLNL